MISDSSLDSLIDVELGSNGIDEAVLVVEGQGRREDIGVALPDSVLFFHEGAVQVEESLLLVAA